MPRVSLRIAYLAHSLRSDWNNGNAHFLRGLLAVHCSALGHTVEVLTSPSTGWSIEHLRSEDRSEAQSLSCRILQHSTLTCTIEHLLRL